MLEIAHLGHLSISLAVWFFPFSLVALQLAFFWISEFLGVLSIFLVAFANVFFAFFLVSFGVSQ